MPCLKEHFQKTLVVLGEISTALAAIETYLAKYLGIVKLLAERAILMLDIAGGENRIICNFEKFLVVSALRTNDPAGGLYGNHWFFSTRYVVSFHPETTCCGRSGVNSRGCMCGIRVRPQPTGVLNIF